jgi:hypothetical protein
MPDFLSNLVRRGAGIMPEAIGVPSAAAFDRFVETAAPQPEAPAPLADAPVTEREIRTHQEIRIETNPTETVREVLVREPILIPIPPKQRAASAEIIEAPAQKLESSQPTPVVTSILTRGEPANIEPRPHETARTVPPRAIVMTHPGESQIQQLTETIRLVVPAEPAAPTALPAAARPQPDEHITEVHIGSVEVRLSAPAPQLRAAAPTSIERAPRRSFPSGFDQYRNVRGYRRPI